MAAFATATFTGTALTDELSVADANWTKITGHTPNMLIGATGAYVIYPGAGDSAAYRHTATPPSANYSVFADIWKPNSGSPNPSMGIIGRASSSTQTYYLLQYRHSTTSLELFKLVSGASTQLGSTYTMTLTSTPVSLELRMNGTAIEGYTDGVQRITVTDSDISAAGYAGILGLNMRETGVADVGAIDNFSAEGIAASGIPKTSRLAMLGIG